MIGCALSRVYPSGDLAIIRRLLGIVYPVEAQIEVIAMVVSFSVQLVSAKEVSITVEKDLDASSSESKEYFSYESDSTKVMTDMQINDMAEKLVAYTNSHSGLEEAKMEKIDGRIFMGGRKKNNSTAHLDTDPTLQSLII